MFRKSRLLSLSLKLQTRQSEKELGSKHRVPSGGCKMKRLYQKWGDDRMLIFTKDGVKCIGPKGREETEEEHIQRLSHNARMRFNRSFDSPGFPKNPLWHHKVVTDFLPYHRDGNECFPTKGPFFVQTKGHWNTAIFLHRCRVPSVCVCVLRFVYMAVCLICINA